MPGGPGKRASSRCPTKRAVASSCSQGPIHLLVKVEIEAVERSIRIAEARLFVASVKESVLSSLQFVTHEHGDEIERGQPVGLRVPEAGLQDVGHAREAELAEGAVEFGHIHVGSPVVRSIRSRYKVSWRMSGSTWRKVSGTGGRRSTYFRTKR